MPRFLFSLLIICSAIFGIPATAQAPARTVTVAHIFDGDTFVTTEGEKVRLLNINTPEIGHNGKKSEPFAEAARKALTQLLPKGSNAKLTFGTSPKDRYGRTLAFVETPDGRSANTELIRQGLAHVYTFPDNAGLAAEVLKEEALARDKKRGLWQLPRFKIWPADAQIPRSVAGRFGLVQGKVLSAQKIKGRIYLNFGPNWKTDTTAIIDPSAFSHFPDRGKGLVKAYDKKTVLLRGILKPINGIQINITHPEQIEIID